jgi:hypothetical protein
LSGPDKYVRIRQDKFSISMQSIFYSILVLEPLLEILDLFNDFPANQTLLPMPDPTSYCNPETIYRDVATGI